MPKGPQVNVRIDDDLDRAIEEYRKHFDRIPTRTEVVIRLLWRGLEAEGISPRPADPDPAPPTP